MYREAFSYLITLQQAVKRSFDVDFLEGGVLVKVVEPDLSSPLIPAQSVLSEGRHVSQGPSAK